MNITLKINGTDYTLNTPPSTSLFSTLRGLGFHGVKFGDEGGLTGADTVLLDGNPVNAGVLLVNVPLSSPACGLYSSVNRVAHTCVILPTQNTSTHSPTPNVS